MADCHNLFGDYNSAIKLTEERRQTLLMARNSLRQRINEGYHGLPNTIKEANQLEFHTQGSFIMDTIINPKNEDYDLDEGVYFLGPLSRQVRPATVDFHNFLIECIQTNQTDIESVKDKETCVRVLYKKGYKTIINDGVETTLGSEFHIDLPIYYSTIVKSPDLAHKKNGWIVSDPVEFIDWFEKKVQSDFRTDFLYETRTFSQEYTLWQEQIRRADAQLRRIVRYLKAWCDYRDPNRMPCGIIMTILAANNFNPSDRDDISLRDTLVEIKKSLEIEFVCRRPTTPVDEDLFQNSSIEDKEFFKDSLNAFATSAIMACNEPKQISSCLKWQEHLGDRFPCHLAKNEIATTKSYQSPAIIGENAKSA